MNFNLRKSNKVTFRVSDSESGAGGSALKKKLRFGSSNKEIYINIHNNGLAYRGIVGKSKLNSQDLFSKQIRNSESDHNLNKRTRNVVESDPQDVVSEILKRKDKVISWGCLLSSPLMLLLALLITVNLVQKEFDLNGFMGTMIFAFPCIFGIYWLIQMDFDRARASVHYSLDDEHYSIISELYSIFDGIKSEGSLEIEHIEHNSEYPREQSKVQVSKARISEGQPTYVNTNVSAICVANHNRRNYWLPDMILMYKKNSKREMEILGSVPYRSINIEYSERNFTSETVPEDATVVGTTYKYVNEDGSPDTRYKDNFELQICKYGCLEMTDGHEFNEIYLISDPKKAERLFKILSILKNLNENTLS